MGFFDKLGNAINQYLDDSRDVQEEIEAECEYMSAEDICSRLRNQRQYSKRAANYMVQLENKAYDMPASDLKDLYKECYNNKNVYAVQVLRKVLQDRGYL